MSEIILYKLRLYFCIKIILNAETSHILQYVLMLTVNILYYAIIIFISYNQIIEICSVNNYEIKFTSIQII